MPKLTKPLILATIILTTTACNSLQIYCVPYGLPPDKPIPAITPAELAKIDKDTKTKFKQRESAFRAWKTEVETLHGSVKRCK